MAKSVGMFDRSFSITIAGVPDVYKDDEIKKILNESIRKVTINMLARALLSRRTLDILRNLKIIQLMEEHPE